MYDDGIEEHYRSVKDAAIANGVTVGAISTNISCKSHICAGKKWYKVS